MPTAKKTLRSSAAIGPVASWLHLFAGASALGALALATPVFAQTAPTAGSPSATMSAAEQAVQSLEAAQSTAPVARIERVVVAGNQRVEAETVLAYIAVQAGDPFDPVRLDQSLKALFATGFFSDVQLEQRGGDLVVQVVENPTVNQVLFEGNSNTKTEKLTDEVQIKPRSWFTRARVQADRRRILQVYRAAGRFAAEVNPTIRELPQNRVDVIFEIDEGPTTGVRRINFQGNEAFSDRELQDVIVTQETRWWRFFSNRDNFEAEKMDYDREKLRDHYLNNGYYDFRVTSAVAELAPDQTDFFMTFTVNEGEKYEFGDINVESANSRLSPEFMRAFVGIRSGTTYRRDSVDDAVEALTFAAESAGYAFVDIRPRVRANPETHKIDITFQINEGPRAYIDRIDVIGNTATLDRVIRRELRLSEGDAFNRVLLDRSRNRVRALGFFSDVEITEKPTALPDRTVVEVRVEEQATGELAFGVGYSNQDAYMVDISITERNLRGRGQFLRFAINASSRTNNVDIRFTEPRFMGRNIAAGFELFSVGQDYLREANFKTQSTGISFRAGFPLGEDRSLGLRYVFRQDEIKVPSATCYDSNGNLVASQDTICRSLGTFTYSQIGYTFNWDTKNDPIDPTAGFDFSFSQDLAGIGTGVHFLRTEANANLYHGFRPGWVGMLSLSSGMVQSFGGDSIRINDRFFKGGQTFRGFEIAGMGPRRVLVSHNQTGTDAQSNPIYGDVETVTPQDALGANFYIIGTAQLSIPTPLPESYGVQGSFFVDIGTAGGLDPIELQNVIIDSGTRIETRNDYAMRGSAGISVDWNSPFGPVQIDLAYPFMKTEYDRTRTFRFSTRRSF